MPGNYQLNLDPRKSMNRMIRYATIVLTLLFAVVIHAGDYKVFSPYFAWNNNFNDPNGYLHISFGTGSNPQWTVNWSVPSNNLYGYPASIRGWHYGFNPAADNLFPKQIASVTSIPCNFSYTCGGTINGDFAYDCFLRWDNAKSTPQLEVMVWGHNNSYPIGTVLQSSIITENGVTYDLWGGYNSSAGYYVYTFLPQRSSVPSSVPTGNGSINMDLLHFLNKLEGRTDGYGYNHWMYLDVVEAGFEVVGGSGWASCTWFTCTAD
jgi:hypothetical protein